MPRSPLADVLQFIHLACAKEGAGNQTDRELLERIVAEREQNAFALLVRRHGPMVFSVCRRLLGDVHDVEDAFQATFLVLARRIGSIRRKQSVATWLYSVAQRIALRARAQAAARRHRETQARNMGDSRLNDLTCEELRTALDEAIGTLPEKYRAPIVLCYLESKTYEQASREVGCPKDTLAKRLIRAKELLRRKLERRGIGLAVAAMTSALAEMGSAAPLPAMLTIKTIKAVALVAAGKSVVGCLSAGAVALAEEAVAGMLGIKGKLVVMMLALVLAMGVAGWAGYDGTAHKSEPTPAAQAPVAKEVAGGLAKKEPTIATDLYGDPLPVGAVARLGTVRLRHNSNVTGVAYSPDGKILASGGHDEAIRLWDASTGEPIRELRVPLTGSTSSLAFSPDGSKLAAGASQQKIVRLWDIHTGKTLFEKHGHMEDVSGVAFAPDGLTFASAGGDIRVWNAMTGAEILNLQPPGWKGEGKQGLAFSPDGKLLAGSRGVDIHVWNAATGESRLVIPKAYVRTVIFLIFQDNNTLISSEYGHVRFWDVSTGKQIREFNPKGTDYGASIALSGNGKLLARASRYSIDILDANTGKTVQVLSDYLNAGPSINHLAFSPDATTVAAMAEGNVVHVWDLTTGKRRLAFDNSHSGHVRSAGFFPNGQHTLTAGEDGKVRQWDAGTGKQLRTFHLKNQDPMIRWTVAALSPNGKWIAAGGYERSKFRGSCTVWDAGTGKELDVQSFAHRVSHLAFAPNGEEVAIAIADYGARPEKSTIYLWPFLKRKEPIKIAEQNHPLEGLDFSADGKTLVLVGPLSLSLWDMETKREQANRDLPARTMSAFFSPDHKIVVTSEWFRDRLFLLEGATGRLLRTIKAPNTASNIAAISPDGRLMASCQRGMVSSDRELDHSICLWEIETGREVLRFHPGPSAVSTLAFSGDGHSLISGMNNGTALIWNMKPKLTKALLSQDLESLWADLASDDAGKAHRAIWTLVAAPKQAVPCLRERLKPVPLADQNKVQKWIADLSSDTFAVRQSASKELEKTGPQVGPPIQKALKGNTTLETRRRLEQILNALSDIPSHDILRTIRAIMALERIGSPEAVGVLETLARGASGARETEEAKASVERLARTAGKTR